MIIMFFVKIIKGLIIKALSGVNPIALPGQAVKVLGTVTGYGSYIIGGDLLLIFASLVSFWFGVRAIVGIIVFVWKLLPLT